MSTRYRLDDPGIEFPSVRDFPQPSRPALGPTQPPLQWVPVFIPMGVNMPGSDVYQPPLFGAKVKERVELYLDSLFDLSDLFWGEIYLFRLLPFISTFYWILGTETKQAE